MLDSQKQGGWLDAPDEIQRRKAAIIAEFGGWTNHNLRLPDGSYTIAPDAVTGAEVKLRRILQMIADLTGRPFEGLRVLDLACLEGLYGLELALQGATVVAIEGREANAAKARFAREALGLVNLEVIRDDVRNLTAERFGTFDVVLCLGLYYHLDAPDLFRFTERLAEVCDRLLILDTHVSSVAETAVDDAGTRYWGHRYAEHRPDSTPEQRMRALGSSVDNLQSFWLTRPSLFNLLARVGFTTVHACHRPTVERYERLRASGEADRATFVAVKGRTVQVQACPAANEGPDAPWPERWAGSGRRRGFRPGWWKFGH